MTSRARRLITYAVIVAIGFGVGIAAGWLRWKRPTAYYKIQQRSLLIREHAEQMPAGGTLMIGDSIVERQRLGDVCGPTLNAGISGATSADLQGLVPDLVRIAKPARIVLNIGTNDVYQGIPGEVLQGNIERMIAVMQGVTVLVIGVPGRQVDAFLKVAALRHHARFIAYPVTDPADTLDGLHLNAAGAAEWQAAIRSVLLCP